MGEKQEENDLFFVCSFIEYIARKTKNTKKYIVETLGKQCIDTLMQVFPSWIIEKIDNYNSSMYYENPSYICMLC